MLTPMRYRDFVWPNNPSRYTIEFVRETAEQKVPMGLYALQDLGRSCRIMRGEGEFYGSDAYDTFRELARQFYRSGAGALVHPVWQSSSAVFTKLELTQEPRADYVAYSFEFRESCSVSSSLTAVSGTKNDSSSSTNAKTSSATYHTVVKGDTLWGIAQSCGTTVSALVALNPQISNPNLIYVGQEVRTA